MYKYEPIQLRNRCFKTGQADVQKEAVEMTEEISDGIQASISSNIQRDSEVSNPAISRSDYAPCNSTQVKEPKGLPRMCINRSFMLYIVQLIRHLAVMKRLETLELVQ